MVFSELYSAYYNAVAAVIKEAIDHPLSRRELTRIVEENAFGESTLRILPALETAKWPLLKPDGTTGIREIPTMPLTLLQKRWLKAVAMDPRIRLFGACVPDDPDVQPLFTPDQYRVFDRYLDGDDYEDEAYIAHFRLILDAIRGQYPLQIRSENRKGRIESTVILPECLEYSEKDDKFRVIGAGRRFGSTINLGRIRSCRPYEKPCEGLCSRKKTTRTRRVVFDLYDRRNAPERVLLHFAHFEKQAEKLGEDTYRVTVYYDKEDETELLIRVLSFGPMIRVTEPAHFVERVKKRLLEQMQCGQF